MRKQTLQHQRRRRKYEAPDNAVDIELQALLPRGAVATGRAPKGQFFTVIDGGLQTRGKIWPQNRFDGVVEAEDAQYRSLSAAGDAHLHGKTTPTLGQLEGA
jgi:hypothetical protein